jgi:hypothetical protein
VSGAELAGEELPDVAGIPPKTADYLPGTACLGFPGQRRAKRASFSAGKRSGRKSQMIVGIGDRGVIR